MRLFVGYIQRIVMGLLQQRFNRLLEFIPIMRQSRLGEARG
ncbi:hypothetical protein JCM19240_3197 [Vibrio maritimus]|uniref:Uncharacterized protein n=1 Tax=Vibrio maritimus TaxID=990268 RepID=A0A090TBK2_9VIBR|nr:hypothetical protein JCM19240_3197 [Vibrio maritimus]